MSGSTTEDTDYGIRLALAEVKGINEAEVNRILAARPFHSLTDFWHRARVSRPVRRTAGAGRRLRLGLRHRVAAWPSAARSKITRRDLLLQVAELDRYARAVERGCPRPRAGRPSCRTRGAQGCRRARRRRGRPATAPTR